MPFFGGMPSCAAAPRHLGSSVVSGETFADLNLQVPLGLPLPLLNTQSASGSDERLVFTAEA